MRRGKYRELWRGSRGKSDRIDLRARKGIFERITRSYEYRFSFFLRHQWDKIEKERLILFASNSTILPCSCMVRMARCQQGYVRYSTSCNTLVPRKNEKNNKINNSIE